MTAPPKIFLLGATGFVGGQVLPHLLRLSPKPQVTAIVRQSSQAETLRAAYPTVDFVIGNFGDTALLAAKAAAADIVLQAGDADNQPAMLALVEGIAQGMRAAKEEAALGTRSEPALITVSGTASLVNSAYLRGDADPKVWSDRDDAAALRTLPPERIHVGVERAVEAAAKAQGVRSVVLAPGAIFGRSASLFHPETFPHTLYEEMAKYGRVAVVGAGENRWGWVSVRDCADAIVFVVEEVLAGQRGGECRVEFGERGYYFVGAGEISMLKRASAASQRLSREGKVQTAEVEHVESEGLSRVSPSRLFAMAMRSNSRFRADRLDDLGWKPADTDWKPLMEEASGERL